MNKSVRTRVQTQPLDPPTTIQPWREIDPGGHILAGFPSGFPTGWCDELSHSLSTIDGPNEGWHSLRCHVDADLGPRIDTRTGSM